MSAAAIWRMPGEVVPGQDYAERLAEVMSRDGWVVTVLDPLTEPVDGFHRHILTGGELSAADPSPQLSALLKTVKEMCVRGDRLAGVCLGAQVLAVAVAGQHAVREAPGGMQLGLIEVESEEGTVVVPAFHHHQVVNSAIESAGAVVDMRSQRCPVQRFRHGQHILGVQFHPEFTDHDLRRIVRERSAHVDQFGISAAGVDASIAELGVDRPLDLFARTVGHWLSA